MKVPLKQQNRPDIQKPQYQTGQIKREAMKENLDWWNTCNAFPPIFYFCILCFQGPSVGEGQCPPFTETMPRVFLYTKILVYNHVRWWWTSSKEKNRKFLYFCDFFLVSGVFRTFWLCMCDFTAV